MHSIVHFANTVFGWLAAMAVGLGLMALMKQVYDAMISTVVIGRVIEWRKKGHGRKARYRARVTFTDKTGTERTALGTTPESERDVQAHPVNQPCLVRYVTQSPDEAELKDSFFVRYGYFLIMMAIGVGCFILSIQISRVIG